MNLAADKVPLIGNAKASNANIFQTPWIKKKKLYLIHNQDGSVNVKVVTRGFLQEFAGLFKAKPTVETAEDISDQNHTIIEEKTFFDVKTPRFQKEKLQLQQLVNNHASIQTLLEKIDRDFKSPPKPEEFQVPVSPQLDLPHSDIEEDPYETTDRPEPAPIMLTAQQMADRHEKLQGLRSELQALLDLIEEQNKSRELKAYEILQTSIQKIEGFVHDTFQEIGALEQRLANPEVSFEEFLEAAKGIKKNRAGWESEIAAIKRAFQEDKLIRQEMLNFEKELVPFSIAVKETWMKHKKEWLAEFAPKKLSPSLDMEPRRERMKEICQIVLKQCLEELNQLITHEQEFLNQAHIKSLSVSAKPEKLQAFNLFKKAALNLRSQTWKRLAASQPALSLRDLTAWHKEIKQEKQQNRVWIKWLYQLPTEPGYLSSFFSSVRHPIETLSRLTRRELPSHLQEQQSFDELTLAYLQNTLSLMEKARQGTGGNPLAVEKKLEKHQGFLNFILETRHLRAQDFVAHLKKTHTKLFHPDTHHSILTTAHTMASEIIAHLTPGTPHQNVGTEWKLGRLAVAEHLKTFKHLERLESDYQKYCVQLDETRNKINTLTGQEKEAATAALDIFAQSLASLDIGTPLHKVNDKTIQTYAKNVSLLNAHITEIFRSEQEKVELKTHIHKDIDRGIHFLDSLLGQMVEIERFYSHPIPAIKEELEKKKTALLQLKTKNTLKPNRWFWFFETATKENVDDLSINELTHYRERVREEVSAQTEQALSFHISPLANALKELQKEHKELDSHARSLTTAFKFNPATGFTQIPQYLRAAQHQETLKEMLERQYREIKTAKDLSEVRKRVQEDTRTLQSLLESSKKAKSLSLTKQISQLAAYPAEQNRAKQTFIDMLTAEMSAHSKEMNEKLVTLASNPSIFEETIDYIHETKGDLLNKIKSLPEPLKIHADSWYPIYSSVEFNPLRSAVEALTLSDLKKYADCVEETIAAGAVRMSSIHDAYKQAKESDRILEQKIKAAKKQLDVLAKKDQLLTKKALGTVITDIEQTRAQEPDITQLGYAAALSRTVKGAFSSTLTSINDYKHHIGQMTATLTSALENATKITLTIPQQLEQKPDQETAIALRERFYEKTTPFLDAAKQALDIYQKKNFDIYAMYVPRESLLYRNASEIFEEQQKVLKSFYTSYTPLSEITVRGANPEDDSFWMPAGGLSTMHYMSILASLFLAGNTISSEGRVASISKVALPSIAALGAIHRYRKEEGKLPEAGRKSQEESEASTAAYYLTSLAATYIAVNKFAPIQGTDGLISTILKIALPPIAAFGMHKLTSVQTRAKIVATAFYGSLLGAAYNFNQLAAALELPNYPCLPEPGLTTGQLAISLTGLASKLLPSAQKWLTKQLSGIHTTSLAELPPKGMENYARDVKRLQTVIVDNASLTLDTKYAVEKLAIAHQQYEDAKMSAFSQIAQLKARDHHLEAYQLEHAVYLTSVELEQWKVGKGEFWRSPVTDVADLKDKLIKTLERVTNTLNSGMNKWIVTTAPTQFTEQLEALIDYHKKHPTEKLKGMLTSEACPEPDIAKAIETLKNKIISSIDSKHNHYHAELHKLHDNLSTLYTKYPIKAPTKRQVTRILQQEIESFSRPQDTSFVTEKGRIWNTNKTVEEMSPEEIIRHRPESLTEDFIDESKKRIKAIFSYEEILSGHNAYKAAVEAAEQAKIDLEQEQRITHAGALNDKIYEIEQAIKSKTRSPVYTAHELEQLGHYLEKQARTLQTVKGDILAYHKISPSEQIEHLDPDGPYVDKLITSLRKEIETNLADNKKKISQHTSNMQKIVETLGARKEWLKGIKDKLKECQKKMEKATEPMVTSSQRWFGLRTSTNKTSLAKMSMQQLSDVHKNLKAATSPIEDIVETYHLSRLQTQHEHYESQIAAINKQLNISRKDKKNQEVQRLEALKHQASIDLQDHFDNAHADVPTAINEFISFLREKTTELYEGLRTIQTTEPTSIATLMQSEAVNSPKYNSLKKDLQQEIKKKIETKTKDLKAYPKTLDTIQKNLDALEGIRASIPERWRQLLINNIQQKQHLLSDLSKGLPIIADGQVAGYKPFDSLDAQELLQYETLIEQLAGKPDKLLKTLEDRVHLKKITTALTTWNSARISLKKATTDVYATDDQKKWLTSCLESNDQRISAACKDLKHLSDADLLIKLFDQTETSFINAYKQKKYAMSDAWDPWSLLYHKEAANKNPYEKKQDVALHIKKILSETTNLDLGQDPNNQRQTIDSLHDVIQDGIKQITKKVEDARQRHDTIAKDAQQNSPALLAWNTTVASLLQDIETLKDLDKQFTFKDELGVDKQIQVSKIATFKELFAYRQAICTTITGSLNQYDQTIESQIVPMTLFSINNKDGREDDADIGDIPVVPDADDQKMPDFDDGGGDGGGGGLPPPPQPAHAAGPAPGPGHMAHGGGRMPPRPQPFQANAAAPGPADATAPMPAPSASGLRNTLDRLRTTIDTLHQDLRRDPRFAKLDIRKMTRQQFMNIHTIPENKKTEFDRILGENLQQVVSICTSLRSFIDGDEEVKDTGIIVGDGGGAAAAANLPDALRNQIQTVLQPPAAVTTQEYINYFENVFSAQAAKETWLAQTQEKALCNAAVQEQRQAIQLFFAQFDATLEDLKNLTLSKEKSSWIKGFQSPHVPFKHVIETVSRIHQKMAFLGNTDRMTPRDLDGFKHSIRRDLDQLEKIKKAFSNLNATIQKQVSDIAGHENNQQINASAHLLAGIKEALITLDSKSTSVRTQQDLIAFSPTVDHTHEEIQKLIKKIERGHLSNASPASVSKIEEQLNNNKLEERARTLSTQYGILDSIATQHFNPALLADWTTRKDFALSHIRLRDTNKVRAEKGIKDAETLMEEDKIALQLLEINEDVYKNPQSRQDFLTQLRQLNPTPYFYIEAFEAAITDLENSVNTLKAHCQNAAHNGIQTFAAFKLKTKDIQSKYNHYKSCLQQVKEAETNPKKCGLLEQLRQDVKHPGILTQQSKDTIRLQIGNWKRHALNKVITKRQTIIALASRFTQLAPPLDGIAIVIRTEMEFYKERIAQLFAVQLADMDINAIEKLRTEIKEIEDDIGSYEKDIGSGGQTEKECQELMHDIRQRLLPYLQKASQNNLKGQLEAEINSFANTLLRILAELQATKDFPYFWRKCQKALEALETSQAYIQADKIVTPHKKSERTPKQKNQNSNAKVSPYEILGLPPNASDAEINRRYKQLARDYYPDKVRARILDTKKFGESLTKEELETIEDAKARFAEILTAYETLKKPK